MIQMDNFEAATLAQIQKDMIKAECWECGELKICYEYIVCCTGTRFHTCIDCQIKIQNDLKKSKDFTLRNL
jgi:hypothetical protein